MASIGFCIDDFRVEIMASDINPPEAKLLAMSMIHLSSAMYFRDSDTSRSGLVIILTEEEVRQSGNMIGLKSPDGKTKKKHLDVSLERCLNVLLEENFIILRDEKNEEEGYLYYMSSPDIIEDIMWSIKPPYEFSEGYVYLAKSDTGHFKIGKSINPDKRIKHFDTQMPVSVVQVTTLWADNYDKAERVLHEACEARGWREKGEWFSLPSDVVEAFCDTTQFWRGEFWEERGEFWRERHKAGLLSVISGEIEDYDNWKSERFSSGPPF